MKKKYNQESVEVILDRCYFEFCEIVGDSPCGCDICPYSKYNTEEDNNGCYEAYAGCRSQTDSACRRRNRSYRRPIGKNRYAPNDDRGNNQS